MSEVFSVNGKVAIVTGGNVGIGKAIAQRFLQEGASVVTCSRRDYDEPPAAEGLSGVEGRIVHQACDVRQVEQVDAVIKTCLDRFGRIDVLVNNAGGSPGSPAATVSPNFVAAVIATNLTQVFIFSLRANAIMQDQDDGGTIVNISSMAGLGPSPFLAVYGAAKAGVINATKTLAQEWGPKVRMNCVAPGFIMTEGADYLAPSEAAKEALRQGSPLKRIAMPEDVADVVLFLASDASRHVNGETIAVDGGGNIRRNV